MGGVGGVVSPDRDRAPAELLLDGVRDETPHGDAVDGRECLGTAESDIG